MMIMFTFTINITLVSDLMFYYEILVGNAQLIRSCAELLSAKVLNLF